MKNIDKKDKDILLILKENSRISYKDIAETIKMSLPSTRERILKLEESGYIKKYTIIEKTKKIIAYILVQTKKCIDFEKTLSNNENVIEIYRITGDYNYLIKTHFDSLEDIKNFQESLIKYGNSKLNVVSKEVK